MTLFTKCIYSVPKDSDGCRISVMRRHTLNDGVTPDPNITAEQFHAWWTMLAPPDRLVGDYYKRNLPWEEFEARYLAHIREPEFHRAIQHLAKAAFDSNITILCGDHPPEKCHRRLLAEECKRVLPKLEIIVE